MNFSLLGQGSRAKLARSLAVSGPQHEFVAAQQVVWLLGVLLTQSRWSTGLHPILFRSCSGPGSAPVEHDEIGGGDEAQH